MVFPFAVAIGVGMALGIAGLQIAWVLACAAACAALYMWNTRTVGKGVSRVGALAAYAGVLVLMCLVSGAGYMLGRFFGWARLDA